MVYPGYTSGTSYITTDNSNTKDPYKGFIGSQTVSMANTTTFYISFVLNVANASDISSTGSATPTIALRTASGGNLCYFYIAHDGSIFSTQHLRFGISKTGGTGSYSNTTYNFGTTYLIVIRYDIVPGSNNDKMYMWVDPSLASEPATSSADQSLTNNSDGSASGNVTALQLLENNSNFFGIPTGGTKAKLDAFKVSFATGYSGSPSNSSVAWLDLSPAGAPLPVKFGNLKASQQSNGVRLDWSSYSEQNVSYYEIERSSKGQSFFVIGQTEANGNSDSRLDYNWLDASPLDGDNFYRVKSVDIDGHLTYSSVIKISLGASVNRSIALYPNPVKGLQITLQVNNLQKGNYFVFLFNRIGQHVSQFQINLSSENTTQTLQLPSSIKPGVYNLLISNGALRLTKTFIVQ